VTPEVATRSLPSPSGHGSFCLPENAIRWRPLWPVAAVQIFLNVDEYELEKQLQDGRLAWIFDIGLHPPKPRRRRELRVFAWCVLESAGVSIPQLAPTRRLSFDRVAELILGKRETLRSGELSRIFHCQRAHIRHLAAAGWLKSVAEARPRFGPTSSPRITRASIVAFLNARRVG